MFGLVTGLPVVRSSAAPTSRYGMRPAEFRSILGTRRAISHDVPGGGRTPSSSSSFAFLQRATFGKQGTVDKAGGPPRALLQVYDTEGTASSSPEVLVRLCGDLPALNLTGHFFWRGRFQCSPVEGLRIVE